MDAKDRVAHLEHFKAMQPKDTEVLSFSNDRCPSMFITDEDIKKEGKCAAKDSLLHALLMT